MHLALLETTGNQAYIFGTNKLRENGGASELLWQMGTRWVIEAVAKLREPQPPAQTRQTSGGRAVQTLRQRLLDPALNPPIERDRTPVEIVVAASGKAILLVQDAKIGEEIIAQVTRAALQHAPGLQVHGVLSGPFDFRTDHLHTILKQTYHRHSALSAQLPTPSARFQRLPVIAECRSSGLPAKRLAHPREVPEAATDPYPASAEVLAKRAAYESWAQRARTLQQQHHLPAHLVDSLQHLEDAYPHTDWIGVIHADGNDLGQVFLNFDKAVSPCPPDTASRNRSYINALRRFSIALDECTEAAFCAAATTLKTSRNKLPIVPLVLGGDDLTVLCDGRQALDFAVQYVRCFQQTAARHPDVRRVMQAVIGGDLTASVGVAIIKPHFPFHRAYDLAGELLQSAKERKPDAAIDFQVVYDASIMDLARMRASWILNTDTRLTARPYLIGTDHEPIEPSRRWTWLKACVDLLRQRGDDGRRLLPRTQLHALREALFKGRQVADAQLKLIAKRYDVLAKLFPNGSLFASFDENGSSVSYLIDAMEVDELGAMQA